MPCTLEHDITEHGSQQITEGNGGVLAKNIHQQRNIVIKFYPTVVLMHHQTLELVYLRIVQVDFRMAGQVERLAVYATDYPEVIGFLNVLPSSMPLPKAKKPSSAYHPDFLMRSAVSVLEYRYSLTRLSLSILESQT